MKENSQEDSGMKTQLKTSLGTSSAELIVWSRNQYCYWVRDVQQKRRAVVYEEGGHRMIKTGGTVLYWGARKTREVILEKQRKEGRHNVCVMIPMPRKSEISRDIKRQTQSSQILVCPNWHQIEYYRMFSAPGSNGANEQEDRCEASVSSGQDDKWIKLQKPGHFLN